MLVPKKNAKSFGAVHVDNYLGFIGFCKSAKSSEIEEVDVYLDNKKFKTIKANEKIDKIIKLYDLEDDELSSCFSFDLDLKYFDKTHTLKFKCKDEELTNSPIKTINKKHENFKKFKKFYNENK